MSWAEDYKRLLREDSALCVPVLDLESLAAQLDIPLETLKKRRRYRDDVRAAEREITAEHLGRLRAQAVAGEARAARDVEEAEEDLDLPLPLERYLDVYRELDDRLEAVRQLQGEGIPIELDDVLQAMQQYPSFDRAMQRIWREGNVEAEDQLRRRARGGKSDAATREYLKGNMPEKYGNKLKVSVAVRHQLADENRELVTQIKGGILPPKSQRQVGEGKTSSNGSPSPDDVIEGEVVS
jgi:hypothetical protein